MNQVCTQLTIASIDEVESHPTGDYDAILSVCQDRCDDNVGDDVAYEQYPLADGCDSQRNWGGEYSFQMFEDAVKQLVQALYDDKRVLIHCHKGRNRSVSISIAAYTIWRDMTVSAALRTVMMGQDKREPDQEMLAFARQAVANAPRGYAQ